MLCKLRVWGYFPKTCWTDENLYLLQNLKFLSTLIFLHIILMPILEELTNTTPLKEMPVPPAL